MLKSAKFILLISLILLLQLVTACNKKASAQNYNFTAKSNWQYAALSAPQGLMQQVVKENIRSSEWLGDPGRMQILKVQESNQQKPLYLIDSHIQHLCPPRGCDPSLDPLCGSAGCAYLGYIQDGKSYRQVFNEYLKSSLPPGVPFLRVSKQLESGFPCLEFTELPNVMDADSLQISRFCYNKNKYAEQL